MEFLKGKKHLFFVCIVLLIFGVVLVIFDKEAGRSELVEGDGISTASVYKAELERTCASMCASFVDVDTAVVNIMLDGTMKSVYAKNSEGSYGGTYFSSGGDPLLLKYDFPDIVGCAVICRGNSSDTVRLEMTNMLSAYLGLATNKIYIGFSD